MPPAGPGGRPRNAWESYRCRRLVRLWILTDLSKEDVRKVLEANDFNPSGSDVQKKLRSLLPKDYARDHRTFRPWNNSNMKLRFSRLHHCKDGRVSKSGRYKPAQLRSKLTTISCTTSSPLDKFEGPSAAFRNYSVKSPPALSKHLSSISSPHTQPIFSSRLMLDGSSIGCTPDLQTRATSKWMRKEEILIKLGCAICEESLEHNLRNEWILPFSCGHVAHETCFYEYIKEFESLLCARCNLPLTVDMARRKDLNTVSLEIPNRDISAPIPENGRQIWPQQDRRNTSANDQTLQRSTILPRETPEVGMESFSGSGHSAGDVAHHLGVETASIMTSETGGDFASSQLRPSTSSGHAGKPRSLLSINSLRKRLSNHSSSFVFYVHSVLQLSFSNSWRSSASGRSSWISKSTPMHSKVSDSSSISPSPLSKGEQDVWNEFIDDSELLCAPTVRRGYSFASPFRRDCCSLVFVKSADCFVSVKPTGSFCNNCGYSGTHAWASQGHLYWCVLDGDINQTDKFGNTPLHYAAASGRATLASILSSIRIGADIHAKNVMGESFMHVLNTEQFGVLPGVYPLEEYVELLRELKTLNFLFFDLDSHGRTIMHICLNDRRLLKVTAGEAQKAERLVRALSNAALILQPDSNALDNHGYNIGDQLAALSDQIPSPLKSLLQTQMLALVARYRNPLTVNISFRQELASKDWEADSWLERLKDANLASWIDIHGDTPLTAILKHWKDEERELQLRDITHKLIDIGVEINMRDRNGCTALAIASLRGLRPCMTILLNSGAMPNSRNYHGVGIVSAATARMLRASRKGTDKRYARILSCLGLLADYGALPEPTELEEWLLPTEPIFPAFSNFVI